MVPFLGTLNTRCRIIIGTQKGDHNFDIPSFRVWEDKRVQHVRLRELCIHTYGVDLKVQQNSLNWRIGDGGVLGICKMSAHPAPVSNTDPCGKGVCRKDGTNEEEQDGRAL